MVYNTKYTSYFFLEKKLYAKVIVDIASSQIDKIFDYHLPFDAPIGSRVRVPFANRKIEGYIIEKTDDTEYDKSKIR